MPCESAPKNFKIFLTTGKMITTVFLDSQRIIIIDYLKNCKSITKTLSTFLDLKKNLN